MHFTYPAVLRKKETADHSAKMYEGYFPDLAGTSFSGETLDDALEDARFVMQTWIDVELEEALELPPVSDPDDIALEEGEFIRKVALNYRLFDGYDE